MTEAEDKLARQHLSRIAELFLTDPNKESVTTAVINLIQNYGLRKRMALLVRDYCSQNLRPEIQKFAGLMELKLLKHDPARGQSWKSGDAQHHLNQIRAITGELEEAVDSGRKVGIKAADLANHAMMLADMAGELEEI